MFLLRRPLSERTRSLNTDSCRTDLSHMCVDALEVVSSSRELDLESEELNDEDCPLKWVSPTLTMRARALPPMK